MRNNRPVNWVHVAMRLTDYINSLEGPQFDGPLKVLDYIDERQQIERCGNDS